MAVEDREEVCVCGCVASSVPPLIYNDHGMIKDIKVYKRRKQTASSCLILDQCPIVVQHHICLVFRISVSVYHTKYSLPYL